MNKSTAMCSIKIVWAVLLCGLLFAQLAVATPAIALNKSVTPPSTVVSVTGSGFTAAQTVNIYFDTTKQGSIIANSNGGFSISLKVPKTALPAMHQVQANVQGSRFWVKQALLVRTDWAQYGFDSAHLGRNPYENVLDINNIQTLGEAWHFDSIAFISGAYADFEYSSPAVAGGMVYIGSANHKLYALDAATGILKWSRILDGAVRSSPAVANGVVYAADEHKIYAFDAVSGSPKWSYDFGVYGHVTASPSVAGGLVYTCADVYNGSHKYKVYAMDPGTGAFVWSYAFPSSIVSPPTVANGRIYVSSDHVYALDAATGAPKWDYSAGDGAYANSPAAVSGGVVYVKFRQWSGQQDVYALDAASGAYKWAHTIGGNDAERPYPLIVTAGMVIATSKGAVDALNSANGSLQWHYEIPSTWWVAENSEVTDSIAVLANGIVYVATTTWWYEDSDSDNPIGGVYKTLNALDVTNGAPLWNKDINGLTMGASPVVANGLVYVTEGPRLTVLKPMP